MFNISTVKNIRSGASNGVLKNAAQTGEARILFAGIIWGSVGIYVKGMQNAGAGSEWCSFLRVAFAAVIMLAAAAAVKGPSALRISRRELFACALLGLICHGIYNIFYSVSVMETGVSVSAVLLNVAPVFTVLLSAALFKERVSARKAALLALNIIGCCIAVTGGKLSLEGIPVFGLICGICSGVCYGMTPVIGRLASDKSDPLVVSAYSYAFAAAFTGMWIIFTGADCAFNARVLGWGFLYALIPTAIAYLLYYQGVQKISEVTRVPVIASIECVAASLLGMTLFSEKLGPANWAGIAVVIISVTLMNTEIKPHFPKHLVAVKSIMK